MSAITLRMFEPERHYDLLCSWWKAHGWQPVAKQVLPKLGIVAFDENRQGVCAGFLYMDNSVAVSMLEWVVTNPEQTPLRTIKALRALVEFMKHEACELVGGDCVMLTSCRQESLGQFYEKCGFTKTDDAVKHYVSIVKKGGS